MTKNGLLPVPPERGFVRTKKLARRLWWCTFVLMRSPLIQCLLVLLPVTATVVCLGCLDATVPTPPEQNADTSEAAESTEATSDDLAAEAKALAEMWNTQCGGPNRPGIFELDPRTQGTCETFQAQTGRWEASVGRESIEDGVRVVYCNYAWKGAAPTTLADYQDLVALAKTEARPDRPSGTARRVWPEGQNCCYNDSDGAGGNGQGRPPGCPRCSM